MIYKFSVFTPTFNRGNLISRVFESLQSTNFDSLEWIIIDDGSTDNTDIVVEKFIEVSRFPITYIKRENRGKVYSIDEALNIAKGELFIVFDSDDWCTNNALDLIYREWERLGFDLQRKYSGISCLKKLSNGMLVGEDYTRLKKYEMTYIDRFNAKVKGDKWEIIRTDVHHSCKYSICPNEKYMAPEYAWLKIALNYKTVFLNEALSIVEYQNSGISKNNIFHRSTSPFSTMRFYQLVHSLSVNSLLKIKSKINYCRFYFHSKNLYNTGQINFESNPGFAWVFYIFGFLVYALDRIRLKSR